MKKYDVDKPGSRSTLGKALAEVAAVRGSLEQARRQLSDVMGIAERSRVVMLDPLAPLRVAYGAVNAMESGAAMIPLLEGRVADCTRVLAHVTARADILRETAKSWLAEADKVAGIESVHLRGLREAQWSDRLNGMLGEGVW